MPEHELRAYCQEKGTLVTDIPITPATLDPDTLTPSLLESYYNEVDGRPTIGIGLHDPTLGPFAVELPQQVVWHVAETLAAMIGERDRLQQAWRRDFGQDDSSAA